MAESGSDRARWLSTGGSVTTGIIAALFVATLATNWVVVDVRTGDPEHSHVVMPVPLNLLRVPLHMAPRSAVRVPLPRVADRERERWVEALRSLRAQPEGTIVPLDLRHGAVEMRRSGDRLMLVVTEGCGGEVRASLPFEATLRLLERGEGRRFEPLAALDLLAASGRGELLSVDAKDARVRITTW